MTSIWMMINHIYFIWLLFLNHVMIGMISLAFSMKWTIFRWNHLYLYCFSFLILLIAIYFILFVICLIICANFFFFWTLWIIEHKLKFHLLFLIAFSRFSVPICAFALIFLSRHFKIDIFQLKIIWLTSLSRRPGALRMHRNMVIPWCRTIEYIARIVESQLLWLLILLLLLMPITIKLLIQFKIRS